MSTRLPRTWSLIVFVFTFLMTCRASQVNYQMDCGLGKGITQTRQANGFTVMLTPSDGTCRVSVLDAQNNAVFRYASIGMQVFVGVGVTADSSPNAIIQADDFHPYKVFVVSLGQHPRLVRTIENEFGFWLQDDCGGRIRIWTSDGAFASDPDLADVYHRDLFTPDVVFELEGDKLVDATPRCRMYFDQEIESLRSELREVDIRRFRSHQITDGFHGGRVKGKILKVIFCYLYSGREPEAKQFLQENWPSDDSDRLWQSILKLRSEGVLRNLIGSHQLPLSRLVGTSQSSLRYELKLYSKPRSGVVL